MPIQIHYQLTQVVDHDSVKFSISLQPFYELLDIHSCLSDRLRVIPGAILSSSDLKCY
jgi:hypothetical protein